MTTVDRIPTHPGALLREDVLPALKLSSPEFAKCIKVSRQLLYRILHEKSSITPNIALRLGKFLSHSTNGPDAAFWLRLQAAHDLAVAERAMKEELNAVIPYGTPQ
jgi:addiction module HigA family antidote